MSRDYLAEFNEIVCRVFFNSTIVLTNESTAYDVDGWDSISHVRLIMELEKHFDIQFSGSEMTSAANVGALLTIIKEKISNV